MKKLPLMIGLLFIFNFIIKGLFLSHAPNSLSFQEVEILKLIHIIPSVDDFSFRFINVFIGSFIDTLLFYFIYKKTNNYYISLSIAISVGLSPWFAILSRYLNIYLIPIFLVVFILNIFPKKTYPLLIAVLSLIVFRYFIISQDLTSIRLTLLIPDLARLFDLQTIFFQGDTSSPMLRVPLTGFFYYLDLIAFFFGIGYLFIIDKNKELKMFINHILLLGVVFFLILPADLLMTQRGELIFLWIGIINGLGYYYFFNILKKKSFFLVYIFIFILFINLLFTAELFVNHFDKKNSSEWSYAERSTIQHLVSINKNRVYVSKSNQSDKLYRYLKFYNPKNIEYKKMEMADLKTICQSDQVICILNEGELSEFNIEKDDSKMQFGHYDGLPIYFIL
ncbi:MAG: hypothetical protein NUV87_01575 [Candidatus Roizmanbacteria bacterium]|nr:hypothetical protein [Candidatus Roizmanbacteria bacterium]